MGSQRVRHNLVTKTTMNENAAYTNLHDAAIFDVDLY